MKRSGVYFSLQLKRALKILPTVLCVSLVLFLTLGMILAGVIANDNNSEKKTKFSIGIVGDTSESYLGLGVAAVETLDSSRFTIDFKEMTEIQAKQALEAGKLSAYVLIPEGFVEAAVHGDIQKITYVTSPGAVGLTTILKNEIASFISEVLVHSQKGVYATGAAMKDAGLKNRSEIMDNMAIEYFSFILGRSKLYRTEISGISDSLSLGGYFICGLPIFFLFIWGISACFLFARRDVALSEMLSAKGCRSFMQTAGEYLAYLILMVIMMIVIFAAVLPVAPYLSSLIPEFKGVDLSFGIAFFMRLIPCAATIAAIQFLIYEAVSGMIAGVLMQFVSAIVLSFVGGCLYPIGFFPEPIVRISRFLPSGLARAYMTSFLAGESGAVHLLGLAGWLVIVFTAAVAVRAERIRRCSR